MKIYKGTRSKTGLSVTVKTGNKEAPLDPRLDLYNHSPTGFEIGYSGSGPAQLGLAILADCTDDKTALSYHQLFKAVAIAGLNQNKGFEITEGEVKDILGKLKERHPRDDF
jgi:hypothetical protein